MGVESVWMKQAIGPTLPVTKTFRCISHQSGATRGSELLITAQECSDASHYKLAVLSVREWTSPTTAAGSSVRRCSGLASGLGLALGISDESSRFLGSLINKEKVESIRWQ